MLKRLSIASAIKYVPFNAIAHLTLGKYEGYMLITVHIVTPNVSQ
jgi:hypothetical protein